MKKITALAPVAAGLSLVLFCFAGCNSGTEEGTPIKADADHHDHDHDHGEHDDHGHKHAESFAEAVEELVELRNTVRDAFASNDSEAAHGPLHDVGHLLEEVSELAGKEELSAEQMATVKSSVEALFEGFGAVDKKMHDATKGSEYSEVAEKIDAAVASLTAIVAPAETTEEGSAPEAAAPEAAAETGETSGSE
jgi:hypothetical protein